MAHTAGTNIITLTKFFIYIITLRWLILEAMASSRCSRKGDLERQASRMIIPDASIACLSIRQALVAAQNLYKYIIIWPSLSRLGEKKANCIFTYYSRGINAKMACVSFSASQENTGIGWTRKPHGTFDVTPSKLCPITSTSSTRYQSAHSKMSMDILY